MSCDMCGGDPIVISVMDASDYSTQAMCAECLPGFAIALAINTNPGLLDEDGRHKWVLAIPAAVHDDAAELYAQRVFPDPEASTPPAGPTPGESSDGGSTGDDQDGSEPCPVCGAIVPHDDQIKHWTEAGHTMADVPAAQ